MPESAASWSIQRPEITALSRQRFWAINAAKLIPRPRRMEKCIGNAIDKARDDGCGGPGRRRAIGGSG
jgi:hypothetical protein